MDVGHERLPKQTVEVITASRLARLGISVDRLIASGSDGARARGVGVGVASHAYIPTCARARANGMAWHGISTAAAHACVVTSRRIARAGGGNVGGLLGKQPTRCVAHQLNNVVQRTFDSDRATFHTYWRDVNSLFDLRTVINASLDVAVAWREDEVCVPAHVPARRCHRLPPPRPTPPRLTRPGPPPTPRPRVVLARRGRRWTWFPHGGRRCTRCSGLRCGARTPCWS